MEIFKEGKDNPQMTSDAPCCQQCGNVLVRRYNAPGNPKKYCSNRCTQLACRIRRAAKRGNKYNIAGKVGRPSLRTSPAEYARQVQAAKDDKKHQA